MATDRRQSRPQRSKPSPRGRGSSSGRKKQTADPQGQKAADPLQRLQKVLAAAGVGSRRMCEELISAGRVEVDRRVVRELGTKVDPLSQDIRLDGTSLTVRRKVYYLVNKPPGVVCTNRDPAGRPRVVDLLPASPDRLFAVGRLDLSSEGLMLVTNDGELANRLTHPRYGVEKTYHVLVAGTPTREALKQLTTGLHLAEGPSSAKRLRVKTSFKGSTLLEMVLDEGRNREIRRLMARIGHKVLKLKRVAIGRVRMKDLELGQYRRLGNNELKLLRTASQQSQTGTGATEAGAKPRRKHPTRGRKKSVKPPGTKGKKRPAAGAAASSPRGPATAQTRRAKKRTTHRKGKRS